MRLSRLIIFLAVAAAAFGQGITHTDDFLVSVRGLAPEARLKDAFIVPVSLPLPEYPAELIRAGIAGEASIRFHVTDVGAVGEIEVLKVSQREFAEAIKEAIARWRFQAYAVDGITKIKRSAWFACRIQFRREEE
jgi:TonB family protein